MATVQFQPVRAFRAARILFSNPDDLPQVFTIIDALSGNTLARTTRRLQASAAGQRLLAARPDIVDKLADRAMLARLPEGSLGRAYLDFVTRENISADGIRTAADEGRTREVPLDAPLDWVYARLRDTHDLWHAAVGYSGDVLGETALLAFTFAQTFNPAIALIIGLGLLKTVGAAQGGEDARRTIFDGWKRGRRAKWLVEQDWEALLAQPLAEVRDQLALYAPPAYRPIRSYELRGSVKQASVEVAA